MIELEKVIAALTGQDPHAVTQLVQRALDEGIKAEDVLNQGLIPGMDVIGERMQSGEMFIPEVLMAAKKMRAGVSILKPLLGDATISVAGKVAIGTVKGDLHDIGKNLVKMMMESAGFEVNDLGVDVAPEKFVKAVTENDADIVALSALLTTTMPMMKETVDALRESGVRDSVKVMVGGAPVTKKFADDIGADGYAPDAGSANKMAKTLMALG